MKIYIVLLLALLLLPVIQAESFADIQIRVTDNDLSVISYSLQLNIDDEYSSFEFETGRKPSGIIFEGDYSLIEGETYTILFEQEISPENSLVEFTLVNDDLIESQRNKKIFRTTFSLAEYDIKRIEMTLPSKYFLSEEPNTVPQADSLSTDGQRIILNWEFREQDQIPLAVFYEKESDNWLWVIILFAVALLGIAYIKYYFNNKMKLIVEDTLTDNEKAVINEIKKGVIKQKEIARNLEFSKSKMSKVVRKLEEKDLVEREPYFKTNKLKIKKIN